MAGGAGRAASPHVVRTLGGPRSGPRAVAWNSFASALRAGLPYASLSARGLGVPPGEATTPSRSCGSRRARSPAASSERRLSPEESDRLVRLARIASLAEEVLGDAREGRALAARRESGPRRRASPLAARHRPRRGRGRGRPPAPRPRRLRLIRGPLRVWRLCKRAHAAFDGEGARLAGGRWNRRGTPHRLRRRRACRSRRSRSWSTPTPRSCRTISSRSPRTFRTRSRIETRSTTRDLPSRLAPLPRSGVAGRARNAPGPSAARSPVLVGPVRRRSSGAQLPAQSGAPGHSRKIRSSATRRAASPLAHAAAGLRSRSTPR